MKNDDNIKIFCKFDNDKQPIETVLCRAFCDYMDKEKNFNKCDVNSRHISKNALK